jgi:uncharacterized Zn-binding protein involved in type VI secretion
MPAAARVTDPAGHPGNIAPPGVPTVLIAGMPAATVNSLVGCAAPSHAGAMIAPPGCPTVLIGGLPAARMGDVTTCGAPIMAGATNVMIGG